MRVKGVSEGNKFKISVAYTAEQFEWIDAYAQKWSISFAEAVRRLVNRQIKFEERERVSSANSVRISP